MKVEILKDAGVRQRWIPAIAVMITVVVTVVGASYHLGVKLGALDIRIQQLEDFKKKGGRYTQQDGNKLESRVAKIEEDVDGHRHQVPPRWVEEQLEIHDELVKKSIEASQRTREAIIKMQQQIFDVTHLIEHAVRQTKESGK